MKLTATLTSTLWDRRVLERLYLTSACATYGFYGAGSKACGELPGDEVVGTTSRCRCWPPLPLYGGAGVGVVCVRYVPPDDNPPLHPPYGGLGLDPAG